MVAFAGRLLALGQPILRPCSGKLPTRQITPAEQHVHRASHLGAMRGCPRLRRPHALAGTDAIRCYSGEQQRFVVFWPDKLPCLRMCYEGIRAALVRCATHRPGIRFETWHTRSANLKNMLPHYPKNRPEAAPLVSNGSAWRLAAGSGDATGMPFRLVVRGMFPETSSRTAGPVDW